MYKKGRKTGAVSSGKLICEGNWRLLFFLFSLLDIVFRKNRSTHQFSDKQNQDFSHWWCGWDCLQTNILSPQKSKKLLFTTKRRKFWTITKVNSRENDVSQFFFGASGAAISCVAPLLSSIGCVRVWHWHLCLWKCHNKNCLSSSAPLVPGMKKSKYCTNLYRNKVCQSLSQQGKQNAFFSAYRHCIARRKKMKRRIDKTESF